MANKQKRNIIIVLIAGLVVCYLIHIAGGRIVNEDEVYVHGFVYAKRTGKLFTGTVKSGDARNFGKYSFCEGQPCGHFEARYHGDLTREGKYLDRSMLPPEVQGNIGRGTFAISIWNEGPFDPDHPEYLEVEILDTNYQIYELEDQQQIDRVANTVAKYASGLRYRSISIVYESDFFLDARYRQGYEYEMINGKPAYRTQWGQ
jgi:hypothetical protein